MSKVALDEIDHQILDILIDNTRIPFTDISKRLLISAGTVHVRVRKMEESGIIKGSSLNLDYVKLGYSFIAYVGNKLRSMVGVIFSNYRSSLGPPLSITAIITITINPNKSPT